jgi:hypothetical protein
MRRVEFILPKIKISKEHHGPHMSSAMATAHEETPHGVSGDAIAVLTCVFPCQIMSNKSIKE